MIEEKKTDNLLQSFDNSSKDISTVSSCLLKSSSAHTWQDAVYESVNSCITKIESDFRKDVTFLDFEGLISRGREIFEVQIESMQTTANEAMTQADSAISWNGGKVF